MLLARAQILLHRRRFYVLGVVAVVHKHPPVVVPRPQLTLSPPSQQRISYWETLLTTKRFAALLAIFLPVIVTSPVLLLPERWRGVWWYGLLVAQMERGGPTFIKVRPTSALMAPLIISSSLNGPHRVQIYFPQSFATV